MKINNILLVTSEAHPLAQQALADLGVLRINSASEAVQTTAEAAYDLAVIDDQPGAADLVARLHRRHPKLPIVVLSSDPSWQRAREAWRAGAADVLSKEQEITELPEAIKQILGGAERSILFVDDDKTFLGAWARLLRDDGYSVATASSPAAALQAITSQSFGLAVVDVRLEHPFDPEDQSGLRVAEAASRRGIATIILTGHPNFEVLRRAIRRAESDLVYKGEGFAALRNRIEAAFEHAEEN